MMLDGDTTAKGAGGTDGPGPGAVHMKAAVGPGRAAQCAEAEVGSEQGTIWKVLPNEAIEAKAANEFSRQTFWGGGGRAEEREKSTPQSRGACQGHTGLVDSAPFSLTAHLFPVP